MDILMVAAELSPYARGSDTGDAVAGLAKALRQLGHRVTVALPRHPGFEAGGLLMARRLTPLPLGSGELTVLDGQLPSGVELTLFDDPPLFGRQGVFGDEQGVDYADNLARFAVLARGAASLAAQRAEQGKPFDVVHAFDAPAAATLALVRSTPGLALPGVLSVSNLRRLGRYSSGARAAFPGFEELTDDSVGLLELGLGAASVVVAGSEGAAEDLGSPEVSGALAVTLATERRPQVILAGLDYAVYNPATDTAAAARFDAEDVANKGRCKAASLNEAELELELDRPLVAAFAATEREARLLIQALPALLKNDIAILAFVPPGVAPELDRVAADYPSDLARVRDTSEAARRRALAGADYCLAVEESPAVPTSVTGAQRYGAVPIAYAGGAAADAIVDVDAELETGTGFVFDELTASALVAAASRAFSAYGSPGHSRLRRRIMRLDVSWDRAARRYAQLYRKARG